MITAIDSSVLHAIVNREAKAFEWTEALAKARGKGRLVICDVVYAEIAPAFPSMESLEKTLSALGVEFDVITEEAAFLAGRIFRSYRDSKGPRTRLIPDFLIGAHAQTQCSCLATADMGYLKKYFTGLQILTI